MTTQPYPVRQVERQTAAQSPRSALLAMLVHMAPLLSLLLAGLLLRLWFIAVSPLNPAFSTADDGDYYRRALRLAVTGVYLDDSWLIRPPGHIFFFALPLRLALLVGLPQYGVLLVQLAQTLLGVLTALLGFDLARRLFNRRAGLLFAALLSLWYPFVELSSVLFSELLYIFLFTLHLWLLVRYDQSGRLAWLASAGLTLGAAALVRSPALYALVFVALWLVVRSLAVPLSLGTIARAVRRVVLPLALFVVATLLVVGPWTWRNYLVYQRFIPVDTLGPINIWLDFGSPDDRNNKIQQLLQFPQADRQAYAVAQLQQELDGRYWLLFKDAWENLRHVWKAQFIEDFFVKSSFFSRPLRETWPLGVVGDLLWLTFTLAGVIGLIVPARDGLHNRLLALAWLSYTFFTLMLLHVEPRYLLPIWFLLGLYGAAALAHPVATLAVLRRSLPLALLTLALVGSVLYLILSYRNYPAVLVAGVARERAVRVGDAAYARGDFAPAEAAFRQALDAQPASFDLRTSLALAIAAQGRIDEAWELVKQGGPRRTDLVAGHLARALGREKTARFLLDRVEYTAGEDSQLWAMRWLPTLPVQRLQLGNQLDLGYIAGFSPGEDNSTWSFRWLEGNGRIRLPLHRPLAIGDRLSLRLAGGLPGTTPLEVRFADGTSAQLTVAQGQWRVYYLPVPPALAGEQLLDITLHAPTFVPALNTPASDDIRTLSLMVSHVSVD